MEHGHQGRYIEGYNLAKKYDLRFLFGCEAYWVKDRLLQDNTNCHIYLGAKNENGRQCINDILSEANISGFYSRPRVDIPLILSLPKDDVWVTTACVAGWKYEDSDAIFEQFADHFQKNFFFEVQYHNTDSQKRLNKHILELRDKLSVPIIMGCDSHFIYNRQEADRAYMLEARNFHYEDEVGWFMDYPDDKTAYNRFIEQGILTPSQIDEAMSNTNVFLDVGDYDCPIFNSEIKLPTIYPEWTQAQRDAEYEMLVWKGWYAYKSSVPEEKYPLYVKEIQDEIDTVKECGMADYFIMNHHIIKKGIENGGMLTKTGRGSAVSFITNKLLGFTEVDRVAAKVKMYPSRFMSAERILASGSLPDIDFNVAEQEPFELAQQQILGEDHAYPMISYGTLKTSAAWKLYAKSQGVSFELANSVSEQIKKYEEAVKQTDEDDKDSIDPLDFIDKEYHEIFKKSADYRGIVSSWSVAPCSYLLYQGSIRREIGLVRTKKKLCTIMDGHWAEEGHFLKNDLLVVKVVELIYKAYERIGIPVPSVNELLRMCPPEDEAWQMYAKQCCMGLNQVERTGTSARVAKYKPINISELCAFVAAIRPGSKSIYKIFEKREPFSYDVKAFDSLLQTEEMPHSFVLYQEQEMAALNYAGIPMSDCYTAIKNIAKKRAEKVMAYKQAFLDGFTAAIISDEGKTDAEAKVISANLWKIIEDSASYLFNASHAYCVSLDSLYCAWAKAHKPVEFYETLLKIYEKNGDKDKWQSAKQEAMHYFPIRFPPLRFGQDNRSVVGDAEKMEIMSSIASIKGFGANVGQNLFDCGELKPKNFMDVLKYLAENSIKAQVLTLIKIDYFSQFGNQAELFRINDMFVTLNYGVSKTMAKAKVSPEIATILSRHATDVTKTGKISTRYTITDMDGLLDELEAYILSQNIEDLGIRVKIQNQFEIMGYSDLTTGKLEDRRKLMINEAFPLRSKKDQSIWGYVLATRSIGTGKTARLTLRSRLYNLLPIKEGDIIYAKNVSQEKSGYWYLNEYEIVV